MGELTKAEVRDEAARLGLRTAAKPDSQDVCFIRSDEGRRGLPGASGCRCTPGRLVDDATGDGRRHGRAVELVTVGQRRGMGRASTAAAATSWPWTSPARRVRWGRRRGGRGAGGRPSAPADLGRTGPLGRRATVALAQMQRPRRRPRRAPSATGDAVCASTSRQRLVAPARPWPSTTRPTPTSVVGSGVAASSRRQTPVRSAHPETGRRHDPAGTGRGAAGLIAYHNDRYHRLDAPEITDADYDALVAELRAIEDDHPDLVDAGLAHPAVGAAPSVLFAPVHHRVPMMSLDNAFDLDELQAWVDRLARVAPETAEPHSCAS